MRCGGKAESDILPRLNRTLTGRVRAEHHRRGLGAKHEESKCVRKQTDPAGQYRRAEKSTSKLRSNLRETEPLSKAELQQKAKGRDALLTLVTDTVDGDLLDAAGRQLKSWPITRSGSTTSIWRRPRRRGVILTNTPGVLDDATATHTLALLLATARRVVESDRYVREGKWKGWAAMAFVGLDVDGKTLGIAGLGRIGSNVARKAKGFNMTVIYSDMRRNAEFERQFGATYVDKETLLKESDFLTLHLPLTPETKHYIGEKELKLMKKTAVLINASRGPVVDEKALVKALREKQIWGAGLDVFERNRRSSPAWPNSTMSSSCRTSPRPRLKPGWPWAG